jgi:RNA polymerase primary sigma factor
VAGQQRRGGDRAAEELRLARLASGGDEAARRRLVRSNLRLVVSIARRYQGRGVDLLDLIQEGNLGLIAAAQHYDWRRDVKFATDATWPIRSELLRALSTSSRLIRLPLRVAESATRVKRTEAETGAALASAGGIAGTG